MKKIFLIAAIVYSVAANSQITKVNLQASGLTCSMCSNSIHKALKTLDFIEKIDPNIKTSSFDIIFKPNSLVEFDKIKKEVEDAGFFVASFRVTMYFDNVKIKSNETVIIENRTLKFINVKEQILNGANTIKIIDKGFVSTKEFKQNTFPSGVSKSEKIYHVTI